MVKCIDNVCIHARKHDGFNGKMAREKSIIYCLMINTEARIDRCINENIHERLCE